MLTLICLTKSYNMKDFAIWCNYHSLLGCKLHVIDNDSFVNIHSCLTSCSNVNICYHKIAGFANQWHLFSDILNGLTDIKFNDTDLVMFVDDDEFLWYDSNKYQTLESAIRSQFTQTNCILLPEILMSTRHLLKHRTQILPISSCWRRNDIASQGKACVKWRNVDKYSYIVNNVEIGHVPWINGIRSSKVIGSGMSSTTYGLCDYSAPVRLYHYHIKSEEDWNIKITRGSAAVNAAVGQNGSYQADITANKKYGNYIVQDFTMKNAMHDLNLINMINGRCIESVDRIKDSIC